MFGIFRKNDSLEKHFRNKPKVHEIRRLFKIVVIDDDPESFPVEQLQADGYTLEYWDKIDAHRLERLERAEFDIIVLDIKGITTASLSANGGIGILERIKHVNPNQLVVAFSGQTWETSQLAFFKLADDVLAKPVTHVKCKDLIDKLIESNLTIEHQWKSLEAVLNKSGAKPKEVEKLRKYLGKCLDGKTQPSSEEVKKIALSSIGEVETCLRLVKTIWQIADLATS